MDARKKLVILGTSYSVIEVPYFDPDYEIWAVSSAIFHKEIKRIDALFEIHNDYCVEWNLKQGGDYKKIPTGMTYVEKVDDLRTNLMQNPVRFPKDEILEHYKGTIEGKYFASSIAWMMGLAIMQGYQHIELHQCHFRGDDDYGKQKANAEFWIGYARGRGINVVLPPDGYLCEFPYLYAYGQPQIQQEKLQSQNKMLELKIRMLSEERDKYKDQVLAMKDKGATLDEMQDLSNMIYSYDAAIWKMKGALEQNDFFSDYFMLPKRYSSSWQLDYMADRGYKREVK